MVRADTTSSHPRLTPLPSETVSQFRSWFESLTTNGIVSIVNSSIYPFALSLSKGSEHIATQSLEGEEVFDFAKNENFPSSRSRRVL